VQTSDLYESVTKRIVADLEKGVAPWVKPWKGGNGGGIMPINAATRRYYTGINVLILWSARDEHGYPSPQWMTFKQAIDKGGYVRKGEKGTPVIFAKKLTFNEGDEDERKIFMHRSFTVFNVAQIEELPKEDVAETIIPEDAASTFVAATLADIRVGGDMAGYIPSKDYITLPPAAAFKSMESYYATTFHELGHWSGAEKRLDRNLTTRFGTEAYAAEELVAELTSAFLCAELGVQGELRHAGYINNWLTLLRSDPKAIFAASSKASQAAHYLCSFSQMDGVRQGDNQ
jgi:antirestriction protein ArdC